MRKIAVICFEVLRDFKQTSKKNYGISLEQLPKNGIRKGLQSSRMTTKGAHIRGHVWLLHFPSVVKMIMMFQGGFFEF